MTIRSSSEAETQAAAARLAPRLRPGDLVRLEGPLGAGKTCFVRGVLRAIGWESSVRSPTFNLIQVYPTSPPVVHADLYRLSSAAGLGLEEYGETHVCLVEWADRLGETSGGREWRVTISFDGQGRRIDIEGPDA